MILFFDRNVGVRIPRSLQVFKLPGVEIKFHQEVFKQEEQDDVWLAQVGSWDWVVIAQDYKFHELPNELAALKQYAIGCFYLWGAQAPAWETFRLFTRAYDRIVERARTTPRPFVYKVTKDGRLLLVPLP